MRDDRRGRGGKRYPRLPGIVLMAAVVALSPAGCSTRRPETAGPGSPGSVSSEPAPVRPVGVVRVVDPATGGVVIDFGVNQPPSRGAKVVFRRDGRAIGEGRVADPVDPPFAAAEIVRGIPRAGDLVE